MTKVTMVFVHGFLGSSQDWSAVISRLPAWVESHCIDLPGHGVNMHLNLPNFQDFSDCFIEMLKSFSHSTQPLVLVGYSLGARLIMHSVTPQLCADLNIIRIVLEGGNFGLFRRSDKESRWRSDLTWSERFENEPLEQVLDDWYQQEVFVHLTSQQRSQLVAERCCNLGRSLANVMRATSLAKQPYLLPRLDGLPMTYIVGEKDAKFRTLYRDFGLQYQLIAQAGHNAHKEQPQRFTAALMQVLA